MSTSLRLITINLGRVATSVEGLSLTKPDVPLITWSLEKKTLYLHFHNTYKHETWHNGDLGQGA